MHVHRIRTTSRFLASVATCLLPALLLPNVAQAGTHHKPLTRSASAGRYSGSGTSRGVVEEAVEPQLTTGQIAEVETDNAPIIADRQQYGRLLSRCASGTDVIVVGQTDTYYAVEMADRTLGYILKTDVKLLDYQVTIDQQFSPLQRALVNQAETYLNAGTPYVYGGTSENGIDCSALIQNVFDANGIKLPRTAHEQAAVGYAVPTDDMSQWQPGDRLYFQCHHGYIDHAGMYIGGGYFIQSSIDKHRVNIMPISSGYYRNHLVAVRRSPELVASENAVSATPTTPDYEASQE